ncbi:MAG: WYL domain-containing protein [Lachnospiraceae bacterium]|nr:WYL domain-containing protein [Lachnospiraceae bacterium]
MGDNSKITRVLNIFSKLSEGKVVNKPEEANIFGVDERTIQRDIDDIRKYLDFDSGNNNSGITDRIIYDHVLKGYYMERAYKSKLSNSEILAICKILLDSRAFTKKEMDKLIGNIVECCSIKSEEDIVRKLIANEQYHYIEPQHKSDFLDLLWKAGQAIKEQKYIKITYTRTKDKKEVKRELKPAAIMFSEFYFYLAAFIEDEKTRENFEVPGDVYPTIYRIDRIKKLEVLGEKFKMPHRDRFEEGEFRKRIQFMYGGRLQRIKFRYYGYSVEAILDRLPTARIISEKDGVYTISAEVFGKGIEGWIRGQGKSIEVLGES